MRKHALIILGGNSIGNKTWINGVNKYLKRDYPTVEFHYSHWNENIQDINFEKELKELSKFIKDNNISNYSIVAKSAGIVLSLQGVITGILSPRTIVGYGLPIEYSTYRKIDLKSLIKTSSKRTNIICIQADQDPQGDLKLLKKLISDMVPIWDIKDNTHNYDDFKRMANIAKAFVAIHQPQIEHTVRKIDATSLSDAIDIVIQSPIKFRFTNNWLFDIENKICIFSFKKRKFILKHGNINKINKEIENASKASSLIDKIKVGKKAVIAVVPDIYKINSKKAYLVSEYFGPDCNELFYQHVVEAFPVYEVTKLIKIMNELSILFEGFIPRNTIIKGDNIYLIDWENTIFNNISMSKNLQCKTAIFVGWRHVSHLTEKKIESVFHSQTQFLQDDEYLNEYEETFKNMLGLIRVDNFQIRKLCYDLVIKATDYRNMGSFLKIDDILHSLSGILPIEIELLVDFLLSENYERESHYLYNKLSNIINLARTRSLMDFSKIQYFICKQVKDLILQKLISKCGNLRVEDALVIIIQDRYPDSKPTDNFLMKVVPFLKA